MTYPALMDQHGRKISQLRVSLTDRCDFRCLYCMPPEGLPVLPRRSYLRADEIQRIVSLFAKFGIEKIRLTGGEPLLRDDVISIVKKVAQVPGIKNLAMTTNGRGFKKMGGVLKEAGLTRVNISLDSLNESVFQKISGSNSFQEVLDGVFESFRLCLPTKINMVVMKDMNDHEIDDFIDFALEHPVAELRFIEFMPLCGTGWKPQHVLSLQSVMERIQNKFQSTSVAPCGESASRTIKIQRGNQNAKIGFITALSKPFCGTCTRIRITAEGDLRPCLFSHDGIPLKRLLRAGATDLEIAQVIQKAGWNKPQGNEFAWNDHTNQGLGNENLRMGKQSRESYPNIRLIGG